MLTIITTCKGRVHHLKGLVECLQQQTFKDWKCLVVAYGCKESLLYGYELSITDRRFGVISAEHEGFNLSHARNIGVKNLIHNDYEGWILFLDADTLFPDDYLQRVIEDIIIHPFHFFTGEPECSGNCCVNITDILNICGRKCIYDEKFQGWGAEDADLYIRLENFDRLPKKLPFPKGMAYQGHSDTERTKFYSDKDKWESQRKNIKRLFSKHRYNHIVPEYISEEDAKRFL